MARITIATNDGGTTTLDERALASLSSRLRGTVLRDGDEAYDEARTIWNGMIDKRPALIARCETPEDVATAVDVAREHGVVLAVCGGGHNIAGNATCDDGLVVDLSPMREVRVDAEDRRAFVQAGATLADFDAAAQEHGLATPTGINSTTGIAGLTLGGGFGWLSRKHGMTVDNLLAADVVTADGERLRASEEENPELFWAIRGGGGNFGIVTRFEFRLHPVGPEVLSGLVVFPLDEAGEALRNYASFSATMPDDVNVWAILRRAPPLPFLPEEAHGAEVVVFAFFHAGDPAEGERYVDAVRGFGSTPVGEHVGVQPYAAWQRTFDPLLAPGARNYWKSHNFTELTGEAIDVLVEAARRLPGAQCEVFLGAVGGATARVAPDATAYAHRDANYVMNVHGRWDTPEEDEAGIAWARETFAATQPFASSGVYVNFMTEEERDRVGSAYGANHDRLARLKRRYDPENLFRLNQNIPPAAPPA